MARWDFDDEARSPRDPTSDGARSETARRDGEPHISPLPDRVEQRSRDGSGNGRDHALTLPAGRDRERVRHEGREYRLRGSEVDLLERAGRFRVTFTEDLKRAAGDDGRFREDLRSLQRQGLIDERTVTRFRDRAVSDVVSVTRVGRAVLDQHRDPDRDVGQAYYGGWVKPSEVWHDASLFRMVRQVETELDQGDRVQRVILDDELKANAFRGLHDARAMGVRRTPRGPPLRISRCPPGGRVRRRHHAYPRSGTRDRALPPRAPEREGERGVPHVRRAIRRWHTGWYPTRPARDREAAAMSLELVRRQALEMLGYMPRQAHFLVLVAVHGGYFLRRQYVAFTGRPHGQAAVRFLSRCMAREHVKVFPYGRQGHVITCAPGRSTRRWGKRTTGTAGRRSGRRILRKLMTVDFVLANATARFWATEEEKVALLRERQVSASVWPHRLYQSRQAGRATTIRYFVDKMPWYQEADESRLWIAYVDAERTLGGFETFLDQYRALLACLPSGVTYVAPTVWQGVIQTAFTKGLSPRDGGAMGRFSAYCQLRRTVEDAERTVPLTTDQRARFRDQCAEFTTPAFEALYQRWLKTASIASWEVDAAARPPCVLRMHALGRRYDPGHTPSDSSGCQVGVT